LAYFKGRAKGLLHKLDEGFDDVGVGFLPVLLLDFAIADGVLEPVEGDA